MDIPLTSEPGPDIYDANIDTVTAVHIKQEHQSSLSATQTHDTPTTHSSTSTPTPTTKAKPKAETDLTAEAKQQKRPLGNDEEAKLLKKQRRLVRNRMSAQVCGLTFGICYGILNEFICSCTEKEKRPN